MGFTWRTWEGFCFLKPESPLTPPTPGSVSSTEGREARSSLGPLVLPRRIPQSHASLPEGHHRTDPDGPQRGQETSVYPGTKFSEEAWKLKMGGRGKGELWEGCGFRKRQEQDSIGSEKSYLLANLSDIYGQPRLMALHVVNTPPTKATSQQTLLGLSPLKSKLDMGKKKIKFKRGPRLLKYFWTTEKADTGHLQAFLLKRKEKGKVMLLLSWRPSTLHGGCIHVFTVHYNPCEPEAPRASKRNIALKLK